MADNKDLLIAVFGAGGAGAALLAALFARKGGDGGIKTPGITASSSSGGVAIAHGGKGDIDVRVNEAAGAEFIDELQQSLGLSLIETARLLKAFRAAGLNLADSEAVVACILTEERTFEALVSALRHEDIPQATALIAHAAAMSASERSVKTGPTAAG